MGGQGREADPRQDEIAGVVDDQGQVALAGGGVSRPSRCMRSRATRALISLSPPSGLRQSSASQTAWDSAVRARDGSRCAIRARMRSSAAAGKSRPQ